MGAGGQGREDAELGYTADYTRCYLPADAASAGELVEVSVEELHADGLRVTPV